MFGPLFGKELLEMARRRRFFVVRVFIGAALLFGWWVALGGASTTVDFKNIASLSVIGERLFREWAYWSLWGVVIVAPMLVCGLIAAEKDNRTFETLLTTLLSNREILVGKAVSRLALLLILVASSVPILAVASLYGGFDVVQVALAAAIIGGAGFFIVVVGLYYTTITFKPYIALLRTYFFLAILWWLLPALSPTAWSVHFESPWGLLQSTTIPDEPPIRWVQATTGWGQAFTARVRFQYSVTTVAGPTLFSAWIPYMEPAFNALLHVLIAAFLFHRTNRLLRQRLIPGKPAWIFRATTAAYRGLVSGARTSVERGNDPLSKALWAGEKVTERWHQSRLDRVIDRNPLVYRNRVANAFDPERFVAAIQIIVGILGVLFLLSISLFGDAGSLSSRLFERIGVMALVGSVILFLFCSAILAACSFARERQHGSWEVLLLADLSPWKHLSAAVRGVAGSLRPLMFIVASLAVIVGYVWAGVHPTVLWAASLASLWLLIVCHALFASLCHRRIAGALAGCLFAFTMILLAPRAVQALLPLYSVPVLLLSVFIGVFAGSAGWKGRHAIWTQFSVAVVTMIVVCAVTWFLGFSARAYNHWNQAGMVLFMEDYYQRHGMTSTNPLDVVFGPMEWSQSPLYATSQKSTHFAFAPAFLLGALFNAVMFLALFRRLSRAEPGDVLKKPSPIRVGLLSAARRART